MSTDIHNYTPLDSYAILAGSGITTANTTTISNSFFYGSSPTATYTGTFVGTVDSGNATAAQTNLTNLVAAINAKPVTSTISGGSGSITYGPGRYNSASTIIYSTGTQITLDAGGNSNAQFFFTAGSAITFDNVSSITLTGNASTCNVFWVAGSAISFTGTSPPAGIPGIFIANTAITFANASQISGRVYAQTANVSFSGTSSVDGACVVVCYSKGTLILTKKGLVPIENIKEGDKVVTKGKIYNNKKFVENDDTQIEDVMWISKFKLKSLNSKSQPICIKKDALGKNAPFQDLYVSPGHRILLNGEMLLAKEMVNGDTIYQDKKCDSIEYYHLECDQHCAIIANGVLAESYLDVDNIRNAFENRNRARR
jgi:hypothetical protein